MVVECKSVNLSTCLSYNSLIFESWITSQSSKDIKNKQFKPIYALHGEEPYFIDAIL